MHTVMYRYRFAPTVSFEEFGATLAFALLATAFRHNPDPIRLDAKLEIHTGTRSCVIDASNSFGRDLNRLFAQLVRVKFASDAFTVERLTLDVVA
jgi:hypothetical protein